MIKKIYLIDWNSFIYRMFFGLPEFSTKDWKIVNAIFGMAKFFVWQLATEKPDYLIFIKDAKWQNFRHELYSDYKATRDRMPDNLREQIWDIENLIAKMWIEIVEISWYEADDVIWTLAQKYSWDNDYEVDILTWDKDLYSLVSENVKIYDTMKKKKFWLEETKEKFWVESNMIIDYLAIVWDKSDNIPWIVWFWPKKAIWLINEIWSVDKIYDEVDKILSKEKLFSDFPKEIQSCFKWKTFDKLVESKDNAYLSKKLATLDKSVSLENFSLEKFAFTPENLVTEEVKVIFKKFEFHSLLYQEKKEMKSWKDLWLKVKIIWDNLWLEELLRKINKYENISLDTETTSLNIMDAKLVWVSIYLDDKNIFYINRLHNWPQVTDKSLKSFLNKLFSLDILIIWHNIKYDLEILELFQKSEITNHNDHDHSSQMTLEI